MMEGRVICSQIGAREHYAVPRALSRSGLLDTLLTDVWVPEPWRRALAGIPAGRRLATRTHREISDRRVVAFTKRALIAGARDYWQRPGTTEEIYRRFLRVGERFGRDSRAYLEMKTRKNRAPAAFFSYTTGGLEPAEYLERIGVPALLDQIDPARTEHAIELQEAQRWPGWMPRTGGIPEEYFERLKAEWAIATRVIVNSEWSRTALVEQGVPDGKIVVLPLAYEPPPLMRRARPAGASRTVLWLGQVILRKGIQYLFEAARAIHDDRVRFVIAGPIGISADAVRSAPPNMEFIGPITRDRVTDLYRSADLFVFPTLSDGFGVTQLEAMAHGVPVIATRHCGAVVEDGVNGAIVPARDGIALCEAIMNLISDAGRLDLLSEAATETSKRFSIDVLAGRMATLLRELGVSTER
jgi:glycosyltransferase involved in cell wall biosynthesis